MPTEKTGGRKKGTPNKDKQELRDKAQELGIDPLEILLYFANKDWKMLGYNSETETRYTPNGEPYEVSIISPEMRISAASKATNFIYPQLKAIEHSADTSNQLLAPIIIVPGQNTVK